MSEMRQVIIPTKSLYRAGPEAVVSEIYSRLQTAGFRMRRLTLPEIANIAAVGFDVFEAPTTIEYDASNDVWVYTQASPSP